ncbi:hypothetical protein BGX31_004751 [Mortierella sp. GBA43]|nr:hypothetical protein BGX31_004751 [Mortierella sp. GBA43]
MVKKIAAKSSGNAFTNFIRQEITAPEKRAGNTSIAISLTVFGLAVTFLRSLGDIKGTHKHRSEERSTKEHRNDSDEQMDKGRARAE